MMRAAVRIAGFCIGSCIAQIPTVPQAPGLPVAYSFAGTTVAISANGGGETLPAQDFGAIAAGSTKQELLQLSYTSPQTIAGVQFVIPAGGIGEFAVFSGQPPLTASSAAPLPIIVEFRPKTPGKQQSAELQVIGLINGAPAAITRIPITGAS